MDRCEQLADPSISNFLLSVVLLLGIVVSYLPQHWRIVARRSSVGISPYFVLLGTTAGTCALANVLTLPTSRTDIQCCAVNSSFSCAAGLLGIAQITVQWGCFFLIMFLYIVFIPRPDASRSLLIDDDGHELDTVEMLNTAVKVVSICVVHFMVTFFVSVFFVARFPQYLQEYASVMGIAAAVLASIQYIPQIRTTWKLKSAGALSIPMMLIQTPGGYLFAVSLALRLGVNGWSTWAQYVVLATLQGLLLFMAVSFEAAKYRREVSNATIAGFLNYLFNPTIPDDSSSEPYSDPDYQDEGGTHVEGRYGERSPLVRHDFNGSRGERPSNVDFGSCSNVPSALTSPTSVRPTPARKASWTQRLWKSDG